MYGQQKGGGIVGLAVFLIMVTQVAIPVVTGKSSPLLDKLLNLSSFSSLMAKKATGETVGALAAAVQQVAPVLADSADVYTDHNQYAAGSQEEPVQQELIRIPNDPAENLYTDSKAYSAQGSINGY